MEFYFRRNYISIPDSLHSSAMGAFYNHDSFFQCEEILVTGMKHKPILTVVHVIDNMQVEETSLLP